MLLVPAFAQVGPTPDQLEECKELGIAPEKCSEQAILSKYCIGPNEACNRSTEVKADPALIPLFAGIAIAFAAGVIYVQKTRSRPKTT